MQKSLTKIARKLRKNQTPQEYKLWQLLRGEQFKNLKFRRQYAIGAYIVDFCCPAKRLVIELDGGGHAEENQKRMDIRRDAFLEEQGFRIFRVWNNELTDNLEGVLQKIDELTS